jgi:hypothetical protein
MPGDVAVLVSARARGNLSLALRGVNDHELISRQSRNPVINPEHEQQLKEEEAKRQKLEEEVRQLKETLARQASEQTQKKAPRIATIYRGIQNPQRIHTDRIATAELDPAP